MDGNYISAALGYYEGFRLSEADQAVPKRPDHFHDWTGAAWVPNVARINAADNEIIKAELAILDALSVRDLRAWVALQADAPQTLKDREAVAIAKRAGLK